MRLSTQIKENIQANSPNLLESLLNPYPGPSSENIDVFMSILFRHIEVCTPQLFQYFQLFQKFSLALVGSLFEFLKDFKCKYLRAQLLPILFKFGVESRARCYRELKAILDALQVCGVTYEVLPAQGIGYPVDATMKLAFFVFVDDLFSSVHMTFCIFFGLD